LVAGVGADAVHYSDVSFHRNQLEKELAGVKERIKELEGK
jgi:hypothetical protein